MSSAKAVKSIVKKGKKIAKTSKVLDHLTGTFKPLSGGYSPVSTVLKALGLPTDGSKAARDILDIGAGWGAYAFPIARATSGHVYAVEVGDNMLKAMARDAAVVGLESQIVPVKGSATAPGLEPDTKVHAALCYMAQHGIPDRIQY